MVLKSANCNLSLDGMSSSRGAGKLSTIVYEQRTRNIGIIQPESTFTDFF